MRTEDQVRDEAKIILGFDDNEQHVQQGTGQTTTFNQLGFSRNNNKPDGWYLPNDKGGIAIVLETKSEKEDLSKQKWVNELLKNIAIVKSQYSKVVGILYNGADIRVFKNEQEITGIATTLQNKDYYKRLYSEQKIDKQEIYRLTKKINDTLHKDFGIKNLYHRMIFTACALVAKRYGAVMDTKMSFKVMKESILDTLKQNLEEDKRLNAKIELLTEVYSEIKMNNPNNPTAIANFIEWVSAISVCVNSDYWNGEDVMGIFFNEFNRYKKKSESGQVFTPDHITSFLYRLIDVNKDDRVLDAACGSGAFLVKSMCNMIKEVGGVNTNESRLIKREQLFGIEWDREIYALACANMLIHKDGKTNLEQLDSRTKEACNWIESKKITKVLMNPPFERKYGCLKIVKNVLDSVPKGTKCAFILPDKKLEKDMSDKVFGNKLLKDHTLTTIVKLPENLFFGQGVTTSAFVFIAGNKQNGRDIVGYYIEDDGLETVKNQGRQDIKNRWPEKEDYWIRAIQNGEDDRYHTRQIIHPSKDHLSYQLPEKPFEISEEDFIKTLMDYELYKRGIDTKDFDDKLLQRVLYSSTITENGKEVTITLKGE
jgi:type I restriction-modification system DNA methylase subunit